MNDVEALDDSTALLERAQALWKIARDRCARDRIDLFVKTAVRRRVLRNGSKHAISVMESRETGIALRVARLGAPLASFAAASGMSSASIEWAARTAISRRPTVDPTMPADDLPALKAREDLDPGERLPEAGQLEEWQSTGRATCWIECGTTNELLVGNGGWAALRRRNRTWAMLDDGRPRLLAARGFVPPEEAVPAIGGAVFGAAIALTPPAAAILVRVLGESIHTSSEFLGCPVGAGWRLSDEPLHPRGLSGGTFDDAGFPTFSRELADGSSCRGVLSGMGTYRRNSYREPPIPGPSNLVISSPGPPVPPEGVMIVSRCRVIPLFGDDWLLEMGGGRTSGPPIYLRTEPRDLLVRVTGAWGPSVMTPEGVLTPGLVLSGLAPAG